MSLTRKVFDEFDNMDMNIGMGMGGMGMGGMGMGNTGNMGMGMGNLGGVGGVGSRNSRMFDLLGGMRNDMVDQVHQLSLYLCFISSNICPLMSND